MKWLSGRKRLPAKKLYGPKSVSRVRIPASPPVFCLCLYIMLIAIDTEFERRYTYRPILSIVQVKEENKDAVVYDVLDVDNNSLDYLISILKDENNIKIIHSSRQDMEAIYSRFGFVIKNVYDTQVAIKHLHIKKEIGYANAVKELLGTTIEKSKKLQTSNWLKRPLTDEQLFYAKQDVNFLIPLYLKTMDLFSKNKQNYIEFQNESEKITDDKEYKFSPYAVWKKFKYKIGHVKQYNLVKLLFIEREKQAFKYNLPREFVWELQDIIDFAEHKNNLLLNKIHRKADKNSFIYITEKYYNTYLKSTK